MGESRGHLGEESAPNKAWSVQSAEKNAQSALCNRRREKIADCKAAAGRTSPIPHYPTSSRCVSRAQVRVNVGNWASVSDRRPRPAVAPQSCSLRILWYNFYVKKTSARVNISPAFAVVKQYVPLGGRSVPHSCSSSASGSSVARRVTSSSSRPRRLGWSWCLSSFELLVEL